MLDTIFSFVEPNKEILMYILVSSIVIYFFYNFITSILKYPIIIILGIVMGRLMYFKNA